MKKKLFTTILAVIVITISAMSVSVGAEEMAPRSIDEVLTEIKADQGVQDVNEINADLVEDAKLEELGDSVMETIIGDNAIHEQMDERIGGDGSASLTAFHVRLGYNYLEGYPLGMMSLMSGGMMRYTGIPGNNGGFRGMMGYNNIFGSNGMMGYNTWRNNGMMGNSGWLGFLIGGIVLLIIIAVVIILVVYVSRSKPQNNSTTNLVNLLKERYAKGEITHEEYEKIRKSIK